MQKRADLATDLFKAKERELAVSEDYRRQAEARATTVEAALSESRKREEVLREVLEYAAFKMLHDEYDIVFAEGVAQAGWAWPDNGPIFVNPTLHNMIAALATDKGQA